MPDWNDVVSWSKTLLFNSQIIVITVLTLIAFAANSVLARLAIGGYHIDGIQFTALRLISGALMLCLLVAARQWFNRQTSTLPSSKSTNLYLQGNWWSAAFLFIYAISISLAYITLETGVGALILFGAVQMTMVGYQIWCKQSLCWQEYLGVIIAFSGLVYLSIPTLSSPSLIGFLIMSIAGVAWGAYSLKGKQSSDPLVDSNGNFIRSLPFVA